MSILLVDDEEGVRDSLEELLHDEGYAVATATNGVEALAHLSATLPCVVILDLIMPMMDGNQVYDRMRSDPRLEPVPVIVTTSDPSRAPPGSVVMKKPVDIRRLLEMIRQLCGTGTTA